MIIDNNKFLQNLDGWKSRRKKSFGEFRKASSQQEEHAAPQPSRSFRKLMSER